MAEAISSGLVKPVLEPTLINWEQRGNDALQKFFGVLHEPAVRLASASDHYLDSYDSKPGVSSSLDAQIKNTKDVYRNSAVGDPIMEHIVESATKLTQEVEARLHVIRNLTLESGRPTQKLGDDTDHATVLLKQLIGSKNPQELTTAAHALTTSLEQEISRLRNGATAGQTAAQEVDHISETEQNNFEEWWRTHYTDGYAQSVPGYQRSLQLFAETTHDKNRVYADTTSSVLNQVPNDAHSPVIQFINDFRQNRFPKAPNK